MGWAHGIGSGNPSAHQARGEDDEIATVLVMGWALGTGSRNLSAHQARGADDEIATVLDMVAMGCALEIGSRNLSALQARGEVDDEIANCCRQARRSNPCVHGLHTVENKGEGV